MCCTVCITVSATYECVFAMFFFVRKHALPVSFKIYKDVCIHSYCMSRKSSSKLWSGLFYEVPDVQEEHSYFISLRGSGAIDSIA